MWLYVCLCFLSSEVGSVMPFPAAHCFNSSFALPCSSPIRCPTCFTASLEPFLVANWPSSTSAIPPCAAAKTNLRSAELIFVPLWEGALDVCPMTAPLPSRQTPNATNVIALCLDIPQPPPSGCGRMAREHYPAQGVTKPLSSDSSSLSTAL